MKVAAILSAFAAATLVSAGTFHPVDQGQGEIVPGAFILELEDNILQAQIGLNLRILSIDFNLRQEFSILHGLSLNVKSGHDGEALSKVAGVKNVWPVTVHNIPQTVQSTKKPTDPEVVSYHSMTGVDIVHKKYKLTGKGVKVGVIDTGIDYKHPAFAVPGAKEGCFGKGCRVQYGYNFVGDDIRNPTPNNDPMDCKGHGTHVAGIIGANAMNIKSGPKPPQPFIGVAPEAILGAYRVFGCDGGTLSDIIMAGLERAAKDKMDIINLSLGGGSSFKNNPVAILTDKLVKRGIAVNAAAGNDGSNGVWMVADVSLGDLTSSVASFDNIYGFYSSYKYGSSKEGRPYRPASAWNKPINPPAGATLVPILQNGSLSDGCDPASYSGLDVKDKVILTLGDFSRCGSAARGQAAKNAGAAAMLVQTTPFGLAGIGGIENFPMATIENKSGDELLAIWKKTPGATFAWSKGPSNFLVEGGGSPSDFSSYGLDGDLRSKPDIAAPGGNILSTVPLKKGGYEVDSGTSMATPYLSGSHALYIQAKKSHPRGDVIRQALKNTATIGSNYGSKNKASVAKQGAGLVNVLNAIETTTSIAPDHIDLLDSKHFKKSVVISIENFGKNSETYTLSHIPADALNSYPEKNTFPVPKPIIEDDYATVSFSANKIKIPAGKTAKITLSFKEPKKGKSSQFPIYSGFIIATPQSKGGVAVHVPYTGVKGDAAKIPIFDKGYPVLMIRRAGREEPALKDASVDFATSFPSVNARLGSHSPDVTVRVFESGSGKFVGFVDTANRGPGFGAVGRNYNLDGGPTVYRWVWNGFVYTKKSASSKPTRVADGKYRIEIAAQKKLSKGDYPKDYVRENLGTITIQTKK